MTLTNPHFYLSAQEEPWVYSDWSIRTCTLWTQELLQHCQPPFSKTPQKTAKMLAVWTTACNISIYVVQKWRCWTDWRQAYVSSAFLLGMQMQTEEPLKVFSYGVINSPNFWSKNAFCHYLLTFLAWRWLASSDTHHTSPVGQMLKQYEPLVKQHRVILHWLPTQTLTNVTLKKQNLFFFSKNFPFTTTFLGINDKITCTNTTQLSLN